MNRSPLKFDDRWLWHNHDHQLADPGDYPDHLPEDVFRRLDGFIPRNNQRVSELVKAYPTREAAMEALTKAEQG